MSVSLAAEAAVKMLKSEMPPLLRPEQVGLCLPSENGDGFLLGVFVYAVSRDIRTPASGNIRVDKSTSVKAPLNVEVNIAVTSYAGKKSHLADDYKLLERVLQIWHDKSDLPMKTMLQPSHVAAPRIELLKLEQDEVSKIWQFTDVPYSLSLFYKIAPVAIPSLKQIKSSPVGSVDYSGGAL